MKKLDIMKKVNENWAIVGGKVQKIEEFVKNLIVIEAEEKEKVKEVIEEATKHIKGVEVMKKPKKLKMKKRR